jgi:hypothetical protein
MSQQAVQQRLGLTCPNGGKFYVCDGNTAIRFIGCCTEDPCGNGGRCPQSALRTQSMANSSYDLISAQECATQPGATHWYTCAETGGNQAFLGCCRRSPCNPNGCAQADLLAARLSDNPERAAVFLTVPSGPALSTGAIAGIAAGGAVLVLGLFALAFLLWRRRRIQKKNKNRDSTQTTTILLDQSSQPVGTYSPYRGMHPPMLHMHAWPGPAQLADSHCQADSFMAGSTVTPTIPPYIGGKPSPSIPEQQAFLSPSIGGPPSSMGSYHSSAYPEPARHARHNAYSSELDAGPEVQKQRPASDLAGSNGKWGGPAHELA